jgi:hypothetical protein
MSTGNARHQAAVATTAERVAQLRTDIHAALEQLRELLGNLDDLAGTRQSMGLGFQTPEAKAARAKQDAADRVAARAAIAPTGAALGHSWMNAPAGAIIGVHEAPVTMPAVSASAEILFTLQHHVRKLGRVIQPLVQHHDRQQHATWHADVERHHWRELQRAAQRRYDDERGRCDWPCTYEPALPLPPEPADRHPIARHPITSDDTAVELTHHLDRIVDVYTSRPGLEHLLRELEHLERHSADVVLGPARTSHPHPCPWCGHNSLVIHHREKGRSSAFIRCEGRHPCECRDPWCACHRHPIKTRHEWVNSGRAKDTWNDLDREQRHRKEQEMLETKALDARARALALHVETPLYPWAEDCTATDHDDQHIESADGEGIICTAGIPMSTVCGHCRGPEGDLAPYPCPTVQALDLEQTESPTQE